MWIPLPRLAQGVYDLFQGVTVPPNRRRAFAIAAFVHAGQLVLKKSVAGQTGDECTFVPDAGRRGQVISLVALAQATSGFA